MRALTYRLNLGLGAILLAGFGLQWAMRQHAFPAIAEAQMMTRLEHDSDAMLESLSLDENSQIRIQLDHLLPVYRQRYSGHYFVIEHGRQRLKSPSLGDQDLISLASAPSDAGPVHRVGPEGQPLLVLTRDIRVADTDLTLTVGEDLSDLRRHIDDIGSLFLMLNGLTIVLALAMQWVFVALSMKPFVMLRRELSSIARLESDAASGHLPDSREIQRLVQLVQRRMDRSRHAIGNLAHALKTPLALIFRVADDPGLRENSAARQALRTHAETLRHLIERELRRARLAGAGAPANHFNPLEETRALAQVVKAIHLGRTLDINIQAPDCVLAYDREDFLELLGNLVDNAGKWAKGLIMVTIERRDPGLLIRVEDDGLGCTDAQLAALGQRGARLDENREGYGLGLSIVREIVDEYAGTLNFSRSAQLGGLAVTVRLDQQP